MSPVPAFWNEEETILRFGEGLTADDEGQTTGAAAPDELPDWLWARATPEAALATLRPSAAETTRQGLRALEGRLAHALLQTLPDVPSDRRAAAARAYLDAHGGALPEEPRAAIAEKVAAVMAAPELASLFAPGSRGEVAMAGVRAPARTG